MSVAVRPPGVAACLEAFFRSRSRTKCLQQVNKHFGSQFPAAIRGSPGMLDRTYIHRLYPTPLDLCASPLTGAASSYSRRESLSMPANRCRASCGNAGDRSSTKLTKHWRRSRSRYWGDARESGTLGKTRRIETNVHRVADTQATASKDRLSRPSNLPHLWSNKEIHSVRNSVLPQSG